MKMFYYIGYAETRKKKKIHHDIMDPVQNFNETSYSFKNLHKHLYIGVIVCKVQ